MTLGWILVFIFFTLMNIYTASRYQQIPFQSFTYLKQTLYFLIHGLMFANAIHYFYHFFMGKTEHRYHQQQAKIAGFYLLFLHYTFILHLLYDLFLKHILSLSYSYIAFLITVFSLIIASYAYHNGRKLKKQSYRIHLSAKESHLKTLKAVFVSDLHVGVSWDIKRIQKFVQRMNQLDLDLFLIGGDLFDEGSPENQKEAILQALSQIQSRYGNFYIEGNHEYKSENTDIQTELQRLRQAGITVLEDEALLIDDSFYLIGRKDDEGKRKALTDILESVDKNYPTILMDHRPHHQEALSSQTIDLQLSGHTHAGQFLPFRIMNPWIQNLAASYVYGHFQKDAFQLIVSSGMGNWAVPYRFASQAEWVYLQMNFKH